MPIPKRRAGEALDAFLERGHRALAGEFPDPDQRHAVLMRQVSKAGLGEALVEGTAVEMEHTADRAVASRIAADHLKEDPFYYTKLKALEGKVKKGLTDLGHSCYNRVTKEIAMDVDLRKALDGTKRLMGIMKAALPEGHVSHRKDGDWKKTGGQWVRMPADRGERRLDTAMRAVEGDPHAKAQLRNIESRRLREGNKKLDAAYAAIQGQTGRTREERDEAAAGAERDRGQALAAKMLKPKSLTNEDLSNIKDYVRSKGIGRDRALAFLQGMSNDKAGEYVYDWIYGPIGKPEPKFGTKRHFESDEEFMMSAAAGRHHLVASLSNNGYRSFMRMKEKGYMDWNEGGEIVFTPKGKKALASIKPSPSSGDGPAVNAKPKQSVMERKKAFMIDAFKNDPKFRAAEMEKLKDFFVDPQDASYEEQYRDLLEHDDDPASYRDIKLPPPAATGAAPKPAESSRKFRSIEDKPQRSQYGLYSPEARKVTDLVESGDAADARAAAARLGGRAVEYVEDALAFQAVKDRLGSRGAMTGGKWQAADYARSQGRQPGVKPKG